MIEEWRTVPDYSNYAVSSFGKVVSTSYGRWRPLKQIHSAEQIHVSLHKNGKYKSFNVGAIVLMAFVGPRPEGYECCHNDGNYFNNMLHNLRWGTREENQEDKRNHGNIARGSMSGAAILTEDDVIEIKKLLRDGVMQKDIANKFLVTSKTISEIACGRNWRHIP